MLNASDGMRMALQALRVNLMRSALTMLGIVIGVAAVVVMVAVGAGAREAIGDRIRSIGSNLIVIVPGASTQSGARMGAATVHTLTVKDAEAITRECSAVRRAVPTWSQVTQVVYGNRNWRTAVSGSSPDYFPLREWKLQSGRFFTHREAERAAKVCVLGSRVVDELGLGPYPVGKVIRIKNTPFVVVGALEAKGQSPGGRDQDDTLYVPFKTAKNRLFGSPFPGEVAAIIAQAKTIDQVGLAVKQIDELLTSRHRIGGAGEKDFTIRDITAILTTAKKSLNIMTALLGAIAAISLLVGGIGIMNIMLVSVTERTREIGVRMSVGARSSDILIQFLIEAISLSFLGGTLGVLIGVGAAYLFASISGWKLIVTLWTTLLALGFSATVGIVFGFYPAYKASSLRPIEALRYE